MRIENGVTDDQDACQQASWPVEIFTARMGLKNVVVVRKGGFEPPHSCERQTLNLVRLPVPPLSHTDSQFRIAVYQC